MMTCETRRDLFLLDAAGALTPAEQEELHAHVAAGCPTCAGAAAEARAVVSLIPWSLQSTETPKASTYQKLLQRVSSENDSDASPRLPPKGLRADRAGQDAIGRWAFPAIAAAIAALITGLAMWRWLGESHRLVTAPDLQFVSLSGAAPQPAAHGRVFYDKVHPTWHIFFFDLKPPPPGKEYELWFITAQGEKLRGGMFNVNANGDSDLVAEVPPNAGPLAALAVTDEQRGGVSSPQGSIQLLGKIQ